MGKFLGLSSYQSLQTGSACKAMCSGSYGLIPGLPQGRACLPSKKANPGSAFCPGRMAGVEPGVYPLPSQPHRRLTLTQELRCACSFPTLHCQAHPGWLIRRRYAPEVTARVLPPGTWEIVPVLCKVSRDLVSLFLPS